MAYLCVKDAVEVSRLFIRVESFQLNQLSECFTGCLVTQCSSKRCVNVVHKYSHLLSFWRAEHVAHSLYHEAFHGSL